ncbi:MAG: hypothetical protein ABIS18_08005, partial [Actinomycetota bacterium]
MGDSKVADEDPSRTPEGALDFDDEAAETVEEKPHFDFFTEYLKSADQKKSVTQLPGLISSSIHLVWRAWPRGLAISSVLQVANGLGAGAQLLIGRSAANSFLSATGSAPLSKALPQLLALAAITAVMKIASTIQGYMQNVLTTRAGRMALDRVLDVATAVELSSFDSPEFYDRMQRADMNSQIRPWQMVAALLGTLSGFVGAAAIGLALFTIEPWLVPLIAIAYVPTWLLKKQNAKDRYQMMRELTANRRQMSYLQHVLTGRDEAKEVRAFNLAKTLRKRYDGLNDHSVAEQLSFARKRTAREIVGSLSAIFLVAGVLFFLLWMVSQDRLSLAAAGAAVAAVYLLGSRIEGLLSGIDSLFETSLFLQDYVSFVEMLPAIGASRPTSPAPESFKVLAVEDLSFIYPGSTSPTLTGLSLEIKA